MARNMCKNKGRRIMYFAGSPSSNLVKEVQEVTHHRNGVTGEPFWVVKFIANASSGVKGEPNTRNMMAVLFNDEKYCAVFDLDLLTKGIMGFPGNHWRGDHFEDELRTAVKKWKNIEV